MLGHFKKPCVYEKQPHGSLCFLPSEHRNRLSSAVVESVSLEGFKRCADVALGDVV